MSNPEDILIPDFPGIKVMQPRILFLDNLSTIDEPNVNNSLAEQSEKMFKTVITLTGYNNENLLDSIIECLNMILSVNTGIIVYKVVYIDKEIIIYSNEKLNTKYLENKTKIGTLDHTKYEIINSQDNILDTITENLTEPQYCPEGAISVAELYRIFNLYVIKLNKNIKKIKDNLEQKITRFKNYGINIDGVYFDFSEKKLEILISRYDSILFSTPPGRRSEKLAFQLYNDGIIVPVNQKDSTGIELYKSISSELYSYFNYYIENEPLLNNEKFGIEPIPTINSDYLIKFDDKHIISCFGSVENMLAIEHNNQKISQYEYEYRNIQLLEKILLKGNLDNLYNNTFVMISDCPDFLQDIIIYKHNHKNVQTELVSQDSSELSTDNSENNGSKFKQKIKSIFTKKTN